MKRRPLATALSMLLSASMILSGFPVSAVAEELAEASQAQTQAITTSDDAVTSDDAATTNAETSAATQDAAAPQAGDADADAGADADSATPIATTAPLADVIARDDDGNYLIYATLLDSKNRVIATNDPERSVSTWYLPANAGGHGGAVERGEDVRVYLRAASIIGCGQDGDGTGIQEGTTYVMALPAELVPVAKDSEGTALIDPEQPMRFFNTGDVEANGGIYTSRDAEGNAITDANGDPTYEMHVTFSNVADRVDVSGTFQYSATASERLLPGQNASVSFVPGGTLSFNVAPETPSADESSYSARVNGSSCGLTSYYYEMSVSKTLPAGFTGTDYFDYPELTLDMQAGMGVWVDEGDFSIFNHYGDGSGPGLRLNVAYRVEDGPTETESIVASKSNILLSSSEHTIVRFATDHGTYVDVEFRSADAVDGTRASSSYITNKVHVTVTSADGGLATNISSLTLDVPTLAYDDYDKTGSAFYQALLTVGGADNGNLHPNFYTSGSAKAEYGYFNSLSLSTSGEGSSNPSSASKTYAFLYDQAITCTSTNTNGYNGNYYWTEFDPAVVNTTGVNYYASNRSFLPGNKLVGNADWSNLSSSFSTSDSNTFMAGEAFYGTQYNWEFAGVISTSQVQGDAGFISNNTCFSQYSSTDVKLQYQLKKVFANASSGNLVVYRSSTPTHRGRYGYIIVDPGTNATAQASADNNWYEYMEGDGSAKPASWRLHFFNMPQTSFISSQARQLGGYYANDTAARGQITDSLSVGNGTYDAKAQVSQTSSFTVNRQQTSTLNARWVASDEIFWELTVEATKWPSLSEATLNVNLGELLTFQPWDSNTYKVQASTLRAGSIYIKDTSSATSGGVKWQQLSMTKYSGGDAFEGDGANTLDDKSTLTSTDDDNTAIIGLGTSDFMAYRSSNQYASGMQFTSGSQFITIGFFTHVTSSGGVSEDGEFPVSAEFVAKTGDISRLGMAYPYVGHTPSEAWPASAYGSHTQCPIKVSASSTTSLPQVYKSGYLVDSDDAKTHARWTLSPSFSSQYYTDGSGPLFGGFPSGGYTGELTLVDTMERSTVTDAANNEIGGVSLAKRTHVDSMLTSGVSVSMARGGGGCGPIPSASSGGDTGWTKYVDGSWVATTGDNVWDPYGPGTYHHLLNGGTPNNALSDPLDVYVFYAGDMGTSVREAYGAELSSMGFDPSEDRFESSLVIVYRGLYNMKQNSYSSSLSNITYTTVTDDEEVAKDVADATGAEGTEALASLCGLNLTNAASVSTWRWTGHDASSDTVCKNVTAGLSIKKSTRGVSQSIGSTGLHASYTIDTTVGFTPTDYVVVEDFISDYTDGGEAADGSQKATYAADDAPDAVSALTDALVLGKLRIVKTAPNGTTETIYQNGAFTSDWQGSTLLVRSDLASEQDVRPGALFSAKLVRADGAQISAETTFTFTYDLDLNMDGDGGFRNSDYYQGGSLAVRNGAIAERPYQSVDGGEDSVSTNAGAGNAGDDASVQAASEGEGSVVATQQLDDETLQVVRGGTSLAGGEIDPDKMVLRVWPSAEVEANYLTDQDLVKTSIKSLDANGHSSWLFYDWTGSLGKHGPDVTLDDRLTFDLGSPYASRDDLTDEQKAEMTTRLAAIAAKHVTTSNVRVYLTGTRPQVTSSYRGTTNLSDADLVWSIDGAIDADASTTVGGSTYTLTRKDASISTDPETGSTRLDAPGFEISGTNLAFGKYLAVTYDMDFDREGFVAEAVEAGLLDDAGFAIGTAVAPEVSLENVVVGDRGAKSSSAAGKVEVRSSSFSKSVTGANKKDGRASWALSANLGDAFSGEVTLSDQASVESSATGVAEAAAAATSIENVSVAQNGATVYENGAVTEAGAAAGWTSENASVAADDMQLTVTLKNAEAAAPLHRGDAIQVRYDTVLDKDAFARELAERGGSLVDTTYTLENAGTLRVGGTTLSDSASSELEPKVPVVAEKESRGNPEDGSKTESYSFVARGGTGEAARSNFAMTDTPTTGTTDSAAACAKALEVSDWVVTVTDASGSSETYSAADVLAGKLAGASLTTADGGEFALDAPGQASWRLAFEKLERGTTVEVAYTLTVDREAYLAAGGELSSFVTISNNLYVTSADGSNENDHSYGYVRVRPDVTKRGDVLSEKAASGNPLLRWTFDVDLLSVFDSLELGQLQTAEIRDPLDQILRADVSRVEAYDLSVNVDAAQPIQGAKLDASEYEASVDEATNTLVVKLKNPAAHPRVRVVAVTECRGSTSDLSNSVDVVIDGVKKTGTKTEVKKDIVAVTEYGTVTSTVAPSWTPTAIKTVDGAEPGEELAGRFEFEAVEVDEDGEPVEGGYESRSSNDAAGNVTFDTITYRRNPIVGEHLYRVSEVANDDDAVYDYDSTSHLVRVTVSKTDAGYVAEQQVIEPDDVDAVTFDNATHAYGLTVSKTDESGTPLAGATFELAAAEGSRFADGSSSVELAGEGLTSFDATGLVAGCEYVLSETAAPEGYAKVEALRLRVSETGALEVVGEVPAGWTVDADAFAVTAADSKVPEEPTTPGTPGAPRTPGTLGTSADGKEVPQTGDPLVSAAPLALLALAAFAVAALIRRLGH